MKFTVPKAKVRQITGFLNHWRLKLESIISVTAPNRQTGKTNFNFCDLVVGLEEHGFFTDRKNGEGEIL